MAINDCQKHKEKCQYHPECHKNISEEQKQKLFKYTLHTKMKFSIKDFFRKYDQIRQKTTDLVTFTKEILNGKLHFLCSDMKNYYLAHKK